MIRDLIKDLKGIDVVEFDSGLNIWFDPDELSAHEEFWKKIEELGEPHEFMGLDVVNGRYGECFFFPFY